MDTVLTTLHVAMVQAILAPLREIELDLVAQYRLDQLLNESFQEWKRNTQDTVLQFTVTIKHGVAIRLECLINSQINGPLKTLSATVQMQ